MLDIAVKKTIFEMNPSKEIMPREKRQICSHCERGIREEQCDNCDGTQGSLSKDRELFFVNGVE